MSIFRDHKFESTDYRLFLAGSDLLPEKVA